MDCFHRFDFKKKIIPSILLKEQYRNHRVVGQKAGKDLPNSIFQILNSLRIRNYSKIVISRIKFSGFRIGEIKNFQ